MRDKTERFKLQIKERARVSGTTNMLNALLAMSSGDDDRAPTWGSLTIETYPRSAVSDANDAQAEARMSAWVAHSKDPGDLPHSMIVSGQKFSVSLFGLQDGAVRKGAIVWTTVRKGQLLSFAFASNSPEELKSLADSMKTLEFF